MELFSYVTLQYPSFSTSQNVDTVDIRPAPFFCINNTVVAYLNGQLRDCKPFNIYCFKCDHAKVPGKPARMPTWLCARAQTQYVAQGFVRLI